MVYFIVQLLLLAFSNSYFLESSRPLPGNVWFAPRYWLFQLLTYKVWFLIAGMPERSVCLGRWLVLHITSPLPVSVTLWNGSNGKGTEITSCVHLWIPYSEEWTIVFIPGFLVPAWNQLSEQKYRVAPHFPCKSALSIRPGNKACRFAL